MASNMQPSASCFNASEKQQIAGNQRMNENQRIDENMEYYLRLSAVGHASTVTPKLTNPAQQALQRQHQQQQEHQREQQRQEQQRQEKRQQNQQHRQQEQIPQAPSRSHFPAASSAAAWTPTSRAPLEDRRLTNAEWQRNNSGPFFTAADSSTPNVAAAEDIRPGRLGNALALGTRHGYVLRDGQVWFDQRTDTMGEQRQRREN